MSTQTSFPWSAKLAIGIEILNGLTALVGGWALISSPSGESLGMSTQILASSPFPDFRIPGLVLFLLLGFGSLAVAAAGIRRKEWAPEASMLLGLVLIGWILSQVFWIGLGSPLQTIYLLLGMALFSASLKWTKALETDR